MTKTMPSHTTKMSHHKVPHLRYRCQTAPVVVRFNTVQLAFLVLHTTGFSAMPFTIIPGTLPNYIYNSKGPALIFIHYNRIHLFTTLLAPIILSHPHHIRSFPHSQAFFRIYASPHRIVL